jgi:hypothetical protein
MPWETRVSAEQAKQELNYGINFDSVLGGTFRCDNFMIEEVSPEKFLIFCIGPFIYNPN